MAEILIFSGTTEGRELAEALCARQIDCMASVATEYGREVMRQQEHLVIREGRMGEPEMEELMRTGTFLAVVDATHPYAVEVTEHIKESAKKTNLPYLRLSRSTAAEREIAEHEWMIHTVADTQECVELLSKLPGNILLTTGSKELHAYAAREEIRERLFVRVLPGVESIEICHREQIPGKQIIAMQGPFGTELNEALIRQYDREGAFFYCDPPYYMTEDYYEVSFPEQDHIRLKNTLAGCQGKWMVSYNDCSYIRDLYAGYYLTEATRLNNMAQRYEKGSEYRELIITNYDPEEKRRSSGQMTLFAPEFLGGGG